MTKPCSNPRKSANARRLYAVVESLDPVENIETAIAHTPAPRKLVPLVARNDCPSQRSTERREILRDTRRLIRDTAALLKRLDGLAGEETRSPTP